MDWDKLRIFHIVAEAGSLTQAGEVLRLSQSAVSRQIRALEEDLDSPLFHRHPRGLILTAEGEHLFNATKTMNGEMTAALARMRDARDEMAGELKITTTVGFGTLWLAPRLHRFLDSAPELTVDLILEDKVLDLPMREADIAIRMREPNQAEVIRRPLLDVTIRLYASAGYIEKHGAPQTCADLVNHRVITYSPDAPQPVTEMEWIYARLPRHRGNITVNNYYGVLQAARNDLGVAALPTYMVHETGGLTQVARDLESPHYTVYLVYPEELRGSKRIALFREFMLEQIALFQSAHPPTL